MNKTTRFLWVLIALASCFPLSASAQHNIRKVDRHEVVPIGKRAKATKRVIAITNHPSPTGLIQTVKAKRVRATNVAYRETATTQRTQSGASGESLVTANVPPCSEVIIQKISNVLLYQGTDVPVFMDWDNGLAGSVPLFNGDDLQTVAAFDTSPPPPMVDSFGTVSSIVWKARSELFGGTFLESLSNDPNNVILLANGSNYATIAAQKGVTANFAGQQSVREILEPMGLMDASGTATIGNNEFLMLFELGTTNPNSPAFDFQDAISLVIFDNLCEVTVVNGSVVEEKLLRNATGYTYNPDLDPALDPTQNPIWVAGAVNMDAFFGGTGFWGISAFELTVTQPTMITGLAGVGGSFGDDSSSVPIINVYSSLTAFAAEPFTGDVHTQTGTLVTSTPPTFGLMSLGWQNHYYEYTFVPFLLQPGTYYFSVYHTNVGEFYYAESKSNVSADWGTVESDPGVVFNWMDIIGSLTGTLAVDVKGYVVP